MPGANSAIRFSMTFSLLPSMTAHAHQRTCSLLPHRYVFTVYALDVVLHLPSPANFPASAETLYQALIKAGQDGHILERSSIIGFYRATPPQ